MTEPAPIIEPFSSLTGATKDEFEPTKTLSKIFVLFFFLHHHNYK